MREYIVELVHNTRNPGNVDPALTPLIRAGASPRATINLALATKARAFTQGRAFVTPQDVKDLAPDVLRHRILPSYEAGSRRHQHRHHRRTYSPKDHCTLMPRPSLTPTLALLTCCLLPACSQLVKTRSQNSATHPAPSSWVEASNGQNRQISSGWLDEFDAPQMKKLVNEALQNNPNLNAAAARLRAAKEGTIGARANQLPSLRASAGTSQSRIGNGDASSFSTENYSLRLNAAWEPDLWGRLRDLTDASVSSYNAQVQDFRGARLSLAANTARAWCNLITAQKQVELAETILSSFQKNNDIVERNYKAGVPGTRAIDVQFSRNNVASAQRTLKSRNQSRDEVARQLEQLLGRYPSASITSQAKLPKLKKKSPSRPTSTIAHPQT